MFKETSESERQLTLRHIIFTRSLSNRIVTPSTAARPPGDLRPLPGGRQVADLCELGRRGAAHQVPGAAEPGSAARPGARHLRRPGVQAAGPDRGRRPRNPLPRSSRGLITPAAAVTRRARAAGTRRASRRPTPEAIAPIATGPPSRPEYATAAIRPMLRPACPGSSRAAGRSVPAGQVLAENRLR